MKKLFLGCITLTGSAIAGVSHKMRHLLLVLCLLLALPAEAGGLFVAVNGSATPYTSTDGASFTAQTNALPAGTTWQAITASPTLVCAIDRTTGNVATSTDGLSWVNHASAIGAGGYYGAMYTNGVFVVNSNTDTATSTDCIAWTIHVSALPVGHTWLHGAGGSGLFVIAAYDAPSTATSADGITWTLHTNALILAGCHWDGSTWAGCYNFCGGGANEGISNTIVTYGNGLFRVFGDTASCGRADLATSPDGVTWTVYQNAYSPSSIFYGGAYSGSKFLMTRYNASNYSLSTNGTSGWSSLTIDLANWVEVAWIPPPPPVIIPGHHRTRRFIHH